MKRFVSFVLTLRPGVKFSDGSSVTGEDVKFSLDRARNEKNGAWNFLLGSISSVTPKGNQVVIALKNTDPVRAALHLRHARMQPIALGPASDLEHAALGLHSPR